MAAVDLSIQKDSADCVSLSDSCKVNIKNASIARRAASARRSSPWRFVAGREREAPPRTGTTGHDFIEGGRGGRRKASQGQVCWGREGDDYR